MLDKGASISIVIPAYNVENYITAALDSVEKQSVLPDEVILIDDGSTDETLKIARNFKLSIPYQVVSIKNQGQGNARNLGISLSSSEYIYFFDSDDLLKKDFIGSIKKQILSNNNPDIIFFSGESFNDQEYQGERWVDYRRGFSGVFADRTTFLDQAFYHKALFCNPCMYVSKRVLWGAGGLEFKSGFLEDAAIFYPILFACSTFVVVDEVYFLRRNRNGSTMTMLPNIKHVSGALNCLETALDIYALEGLSARERWHIRKRIESRCIAYIVTARRARLPIKLVKVMHAIGTVKSVGLAIKSMAYGLRADQVGVVRMIGKSMRRIEDFRLR